MRIHTLIMKTCVIFFVIVTLVQPQMTLAHTGSMGYSDITIEGDTIHYELYLLADLLGGGLLIDSNEDGHMTPDEINASKPELEDFIFSQLALANNGTIGNGSMQEIELTERFNTDMFHIELKFQFDRPVESYEINYNIFLDGLDPGHQNFLTVEHEDQVVEQVFTEDSRYFEGSVSEAGTSALGSSLTFWDYTLLGMKHIWGGIDHLLFILALILVRGSFKHYATIITAFTVGHSITLALAALEIIMISSSIIEPLIALSIVYIAVENTRAKSVKWRWVVALLFGLVHGFGFAEVLSGTLGDNFIVPLLSFNLGVEIGQIAVLLVLLPAVTYLKKIKWQPQIVNGTSIIICLFGIYWFMERIF
ncbi:HupE/UreJ family protein [Salipaludibacillus neizhouensis]|nr:HupE/UreJ family protein [Salipaludibacillus neizhouensis]